MCYRQTPSQHAQDAQYQQAKDDAGRKAHEHQESPRENVTLNREEVREKEVEVE